MSTVSLQEIADASGRKAADVEAEARELALTVREDWAGRPALSTEEAWALVSGAARRDVEHETAWRAHAAESKAWLQARQQTVRDAKMSARVATLRWGSRRPPRIHRPGCRGGGRPALRAFHPRPRFTHNRSGAVSVALAFVGESEEGSTGRGVVARAKALAR